MINRIKRWIGIRLLTFLLWLALYPMIRELQRNYEEAPFCCGQRAEYVGESVGFTRSRTYQCPVCMKVLIK